MNNFNLCGLCRSGQHAIIFWLLENFGSPTWDGQRQIWVEPENNEYIYINNVNNYLRNPLTDINKYKRVIRSFEDIYLIENNTYYICRDFLNMMASRIKKWPPNGSNYAFSFQNVMSIWINQNSHGSPYAIYYNRWLTDKDYRDEVASRFGVKNKDLHLNKVSTLGEGSSFVGGKLDSKENYLNRYKQIEFPPQIKTWTLANKQLIELNKEIYGIDIEECLS